MDFTEEQKLAIDTDGKNIIVSAGAGSGKTAVLTARVIRKLMAGIDVNHLLVLTFTNEAAREMKNRIRKAIIKNNLTTQLSLLESAYITTFDSFALSIVKKYHYVLNVSKNIKIVDKDIITIYKTKVLDRIFEAHYGNPLFDNLINDFCLKDDYTIKRFIIELSEKLDLLVDKENYLNNYLDDFYNQNNLNKLFNDYLNIIKNKINDLHDIYKNLTGYLDSSIANKTYLWLKPLFEGITYQDYMAIKSATSVRFTKLPEEAVSLKEELKSKLDEIKNLLRYQDENDVINSILCTKDNVKVIIDIVKELMNEVSLYKDEHESYEFNDISHMAIKIVQENEDIRDELKYYFNEIMIDEYQDTSSIQEAFINYIQHDNVYMVGDIKQSIYRFRNANPYIFQEKYNRYAKGDGGVKIDLLKNFRSRRETLININDIFDLIMDDNIGNANYKNEHNMVFGNDDYDKLNANNNNYMEIYNYELDDSDGELSYEKELFIISRDIQEKIKNNYQIYDKDTKELRNLNYSDICIITDRNKCLPTYKKILEYNEIPSVIYMDEALTNDMIVLVIKNLIHLVYIVNSDMNTNLFKYLYTSISRSFLYNLTDDEIYQSIMDKACYKSDLITKCKEIDINEPLVVVINSILNSFNVYEKLTMLPDIEKNLVRISNLIDIAKNLSLLEYSLLDFINYLNVTIEMDIPIKYSVNTIGQNAVKIMNIHKSKGLEFGLCYYTGMSNKFTIKEIKSKFLMSNKYGIIIPYTLNDEINETILKDLYINDYYLEEISEKIRLFYVALTRCREKMIILTSLNRDVNNYDSLVPINQRLKYRSFLDILNSLNLINKYVVDKDIKYNKNYQNVIIKEIIDEENNLVITKKGNNLTYEKIKNEHFSKKINKLIDEDTIANMEYGTRVHELFEYADFTNSNEETILNLLKLIDNNYINVYHEYEFIYDEDDTEYHGIIDLLIEYQDKIYIIDYKLKHIDDKEYAEQLKGYKKYIASITGKKINTYLYSIIDNKMVEVKI